MRNFIQEGIIMSLLAPAAVSAGDGFQVGSLFAVALSDAGNGDAVEGQVTGVIDLAKVEAQAWTAGQKLYWDNTAKLVTSDATAGMLIGVAARIEANPTETGWVRLNGVAAALSEGPQAAIADLVAIAGGESPTEAEHNLVVAKINTLLAELRIAGIIAP